MKYLLLKIGSAAITVLLVSLCCNQINAKEFNYLCFMQTSSGKTVDLSNTVCQSKKRKHKNTVNANNDSKHQTLRDFYSRRKGRRPY